MDHQKNNRCLFIQQLSSVMRSVGFLRPLGVEGVVAEGVAGCRRELPLAADLLCSPPAGEGIAAASGRSASGGIHGVDSPFHRIRVSNGPFFVTAKETTVGVESHGNIPRISMGRHKEQAQNQHQAQQQKYPVSHLHFLSVPCKPIPNSCKSV